MADNRPIAVSVGAAILGLAVAALAVFSAANALIQVRRDKTELQYIGALTPMALASTRPATLPAAPEGVRDPVAVLSHQPLDDGAMTRAALRAALTGPPGLAHTLMTNLVRRDPRSRPARLWLMNEALHANDARAAAVQIDRLLALDPQQADQYFPILAAVAKAPGGERAVAAMMAPSPLWKEAFLGYLARNNVSPDLTFRLVTKPAEAAGRKTASPLATSDINAQSGLLQSLITKGDYDGAYLAWINFLPEALLSKVGPVYDGDFAGLSGPQPFNWTLYSGDAAGVGIDPGQGLRIEYDGVRPVQMASQTLLLKPGQYRFDTLVKGTGAAGADGGAISWRLTCLPSKKAIMEEVIIGVGAELAPHPFTLTVPADCRAQVLSLEGAGGGLPQTRSLNFAKVSVTVIK